MSAAELRVVRAPACQRPTIYVSLFSYVDDAAEGKADKANGDENDAYL
jgi:hypothetical protein